MAFRERIVFIILLVFGLIFLFDARLGHSLFFSPGVGVGQEYGRDFTLYANCSGVAGPLGHFRAYGESEWVLLSMDGVDSVCILNMSGDYLYRGVYEFYLSNGSGGMRYPEGDANIIVSVPYERGVFFDKALGLLMANPSSSCAVWNGDYSCDYEDRQAAMIAGFSQAYQLTANESYLDVMRGLASSRIDDSAPRYYETCDYVKNDFDCNNVDSLDPHDKTIPSGARRQAMMIHSLFSYYRVDRNSTVIEMALNYTRGHAEGCDVWNSTPDYDCGNAVDQGLMVLVYFEAYEMTGNGTYLGVAENMASASLSYGYSDAIVLGLLKGYGVTGNESYLEAAINYSYLSVDYCDGGLCDTFNRSMNSLALMALYEHTLNYTFKIGAYDSISDNFSIGCNPWNGTFSCSGPLEQGMMVDAFFRAYQVLGDEAGFYAVSPSTGPSIGHDLFFNVSMRGVVTEPRLYVRRLDDKWVSFEIDSDWKGFRVSGSYLTAPGAYEYYVYDELSGARFPFMNGTMNFAIGSGNETFLSIANNFSGSDPELATYCRPYYGNFACTSEDYQGSYLAGFSNAYYWTGNDSYISLASEFASSEIDGSDFFLGHDTQATCDYTDGDFNCNTDCDLRDVAAPMRQGWMGYSFWSAYDLSENYTLSLMALNYSLGVSEECDVWGDVPQYSCGGADSQAMMMMLYLKAFEMTGSGMFGGVAANLSYYAMSLNDSDFLISALFYASDVLGNESYLERAVNLTRERALLCVGSACTVANMSVSGRAAWDAYEHTGSYEFFNVSMNKTFAVPSGNCNPWSITPDYACRGPLEQSSMMGLFYDAYGDYADTLDVDNISMNLSSSVLPVMGDFFNLTCSFENMGLRTLYDINMSLWIAPEYGINVSGDSYGYYDNLSVGDNITINFTLVGGVVGEFPLYCNVSTYVINSSALLIQNIDAGVSLGVNVSYVSPALIYDYFNVTCDVTNNGSALLNDINISLYIDPSFNLSLPVSYYLPNLSVSDSVLFNWTLGANELGYHDVYCNVTSNETNASSLVSVLVESGASFDLNISLNESLIYTDDYFVAMFYVGNNGTLMLYDVNVSVSFDDGLNASGNMSYELGDMTVGNYSNFNLTFDALDYGNHSIYINAVSVGHNASLVYVAEVLNPYDIDGNLSGPVSVDEDSIFNVSFYGMNNGSKNISDVNVSLFIDGGLALLTNMTYPYDVFGIGDTMYLEWNISGVSGGYHYIYCNISSREMNRSYNLTVFVVAAVVPVVPSSGGSGSSSSGSVELPDYVYFMESYYYNGTYVGIDESDVMDMLYGNTDVYDIDYGADYSVDNLYDYSYGCFLVNRSYESGMDYSRYSLYIYYACDSIDSVFMLDSLPFEFAGNSSVRVDLSDGIDYVNFTALDYMFRLGDMEYGDSFSINYTVNRSMLYNLLTYVDEPYFYGIYPLEVDNVSPIVFITYPINGSYVSDLMFNLSVMCIDDSDTVCNYTVDGMDYGVMYESGGCYYDNCSLFYDSIDLPCGSHEVFVSCADAFGNMNGSSSNFTVLCYLPDPLNDYEGEDMFADPWDVLMMLIILSIVYYLHSRGYIAYAALYVVLNIMSFFNRFRRIGGSFWLYPMLAYFYNQLNRNMRLKESLRLRKDLSHVMGVVELYSLTRVAEDALVSKTDDVDGLSRYLLSIKQVYDNLDHPGVDPLFLKWVRENYVAGASYLSRKINVNPKTVKH